MNSYENKTRTKIDVATISANSTLKNDVCIEWNIYFCVAMAIAMAQE